MAAEETSADLSQDSNKPALSSPAGPWTGLLPRRFVAVVAWVGGLIVLGTGAWLVTRVLGLTRMILVPCAVALLLAALLWPVNAWLRRLKLPHALAALLSVLLLVAVLIGVGVLTGFSISNHLTDLRTQFVSSVDTLGQRLQALHLPINGYSLSAVENKIQKYMSNAGSGLPSAVLSVTSATVDVATGIAVSLFTLVFLLWDGEHIWTWARHLFPTRAQDRIDAAGRAAWSSMSGYVHGTAIIATTHAVVVGTTLFLVGQPIYLPLTMLIFLGSFVPVVGALIAGGIAVVITLGTLGLGPALIVLAVLVFESELEAHVLQPFVVGRYLRLHPLAIILVLTAGSLLAGLPAAILSVPIAGVLHAAWGPLNGHPSAIPTRRTSRLAQLWAWWQEHRPDRRSQTQDAHPTNSDDL